MEEVEMVAKISVELGKKARVALRLNPQVNVITHRHISTGNKSHKFGMLAADARALIAKKELWQNVELVGLSIHIGSQLTDLTATAQAIKEMVNVANEIDRPLKFLDVGGGLGIDYSVDDESKISTPQKYMEVVAENLKGLKHKEGVATVFEPGRFLTARAGALVTRVVRTKTSEDYHL
jgi:diaminopimelate decarboxylase